MGNDFKAEARKQYFSYFKIWFIVAAVLMVIAIFGVVKFYASVNSERTNTEAPTERVYDYADVLTDEEEKDLRSYIAVAEERAKLEKYTGMLAQVEERLAALTK